MNIKNIILLIVVVGIVAVSAWVAFDRITLFAESESRPAVIVSCNGKAFASRSSKRSGRTRNWSYAPIAVSETGDKAIGTKFLPDRAWCEKLIGRRTTILVNARDPDLNRINSFFQLWLIPAAIGYAIACTALASRPKMGWLAFFAFFAIAGGLVAQEFGYLDDIGGGSAVTPERRSKLALNQCIEKAMAKEGVSYHGDLKNLNCHNLGIINVAELSLYTGLEVLYLSSNDLTSLEPLRTLVNLRKLVVHRNKRLASLRGLERMTALEELQARRMQVADIEALRGLVNLRIIDLSRNQIADVSALSALERLEKVLLDHNVINDIAPLGAKPALRHVSFYGSNVRDIKPLYSNQNMEIFGVRGEGRVDCDQISEMRRHLSPGAKVYGQKACD